jgi:hypothetical protein
MSFGLIRWRCWRMLWRMPRRGSGSRGSDGVCTSPALSSAASDLFDFAGPSTRPRVLFSHIPLFRPEGTPCGRERESSRTLSQGTGKNYQNEMDEVTTKWLIETLRPTIVYRWVLRLLSAKGRS